VPRRERAREIASAVAEGGGKGGDLRVVACVDFVRCDARHLVAARIILDGLAGDPAQPFEHHLSPHVSLGDPCVMTLAIMLEPTAVHGAMRHAVPQPGRGAAMKRA
jgi:hypothetical protein